MLEYFPAYRPGQDEIESYPGFPEIQRLQHIKQVHPVRKIFNTVQNLLKFLLSKNDDLQQLVFIRSKLRNSRRISRQKSGSFCPSSMIRNNDLLFIDSPFQQVVFYILPELPLACFGIGCFLLFLLFGDAETEGHRG